MTPLSLKCTLLLAGAMFIGLVSSAAGAHATTFVVTNTSDTNDTCTVASCSLREAIKAANASDDPTVVDAITFAPDVRGTIVLNTISDNLVGGNALSISDNVTIQGPGADKLTLRRGGSDNYRLLVLTGRTATISGLRFENGKNDNFGGAVLNYGALTLKDTVFSDNTSANGGAIFNVTGTLTLQNSTILASTATNSGAAINNQATLVVQNSTLSGGTATYSGGGIFNYGPGKVTVQDSTITGYTVGNAGGALFNNTNGTITVQNSVLTGNTAAEYGGVVYNTDAVLSIQDSTLSSNTAHIHGGAIFNYNTGQVTIKGSSILGNSADKDGGAINNNTTIGSVALVDTLLTQNTAQVNGGAIENFGAVTIQKSRVTGNVANSIAGGVFTVVGSTLSVEGSTFAYNNAAQYGAAIANNNAEGVVTIRDSTFSNNVSGGVDGAGGTIDNNGTLNLSNSTLSDNQMRSGSGTGGAIWTNGPTTITNSTLAGNSSAGANSANGIYRYDTTNTVTLSNTIVASDGGSSSNPDTVGAFASNGYNLIGDAGTATGFVASDLMGNAASPLSPGLAPLADNGGPTQTRALKSESLALNAGDPSFDATALPYDQRSEGYPRINDGRIDIGAFEGKIPTTPTPTPPPNQAPVLNSVILTPKTPVTGTRLTATANASDANDDALSYTFTWTRLRTGQAGLVLTTTTTSSNSAVLDTKDGVAVGGDTIVVSVTVTDGKAAATSPKTARVTIQNSPVSVVKVTLSPASPLTNDTLLASVQTQDADGSVPRLTYAWSKTSAGATTALVSVTSTEPQAKLNLTKEGFGNKGDTITLTVTASDGHSTSSKSTSVKVGNTAPQLSALKLTPTTPTPAGKVTATFTASDPDATDGVDTLKYLFSWKAGGKALSNEKGASVDLSKYPFLKAGDTLSLEMRVSDGTAISATATRSVTLSASPSGNSAGRS